MSEPMAGRAGTLAWPDSSLQRGCVHDGLRPHTGLEACKLLSTVKPECVSTMSATIFFLTTTHFILCINQNLFQQVTYCSGAFLSTLSVAAVQYLSPVQLCNSLDCSTPGSPSFTISQTCSNSCPLSQRCHPTGSSSVASFPPAFNLPQHQGLFQ